MRITSAGDVGIGTSSPSYKLTVENLSLGNTAGDIKTGMQLITSTGNVDYLNFFKIRNTNGTDWQSASWRIQARVDSQWHGYIQFNGNNNEGISFGTGGQSTPNAVVERMRIATNGNVGIGTSSPNSRLEVINATGGTAIFAGNANGNIYVNFNDTGVNYFSGSANIFRNGAGTTEFVRIDNSGNVGIGTNSPNSRLHVRQDQNGTTRLIIQNRSATGTPVSELAFLTGTLDIADSRYAYIQSGNTSSNYLAFGTGNGAPPQERMRISAVGDVGIGTASPVNNSGYSTLTINGTSGGVLQLQTNGANALQIFSGASAIYLNGQTALPMLFYTNASERMRIDSAGNVGIGTSSPSTYGKLAVAVPTAGYGFLSINNSAGGGGGGQLSYYYGTAKVAYVDSAVTNGTAGSETAYLAFATSNSGAIAERARFDTIGRFLVGATSHYWDISNSYLQVGSAGGSITIHSGGVTGYGARLYTTNRGLEFDNNSAVRDYVFTKSSGGSFASVTASAFTIGSDYRLKRDITDISDALSVVQQIRPRHFRFKSVEETGINFGDDYVDGFVAHELQEIVPYAVMGEKDELFDDGAPKYQSVDLSKLVPLLTAAIKELKTELDAVKAELNTLKGA